MFRFSLLVAVVLTSACGPSEEPQDAGALPFANLTFPPTESAGGGTSGLGGGWGGGLGAGGGVSGNGSGGGTGGGMVAEDVNLAEAVWLGQDRAWKTSSVLRASYGQSAIGWIRLARNAAGVQVTTGSLIEGADNSARYVAGGTNLRVTTSAGRQFQFRVDALVGDISASDFPRDGEWIDVTWIFPSGLTSRCVLRHKSSQFKGVFVDDKEEFIEADVSDSQSSTRYSGETGSGYSTDIFGEGLFEGSVVYEDRKVVFSTSLVYSVCVGACGFSAAQDYIYTHDTTLTRDGVSWNLDYTSGWKKQGQYSVNDVQYWQGSITGPVAGRLERRPVANQVEGLDVVIGLDRFTTRAVTLP
jgi:hypothetical protein